MEAYKILLTEDDQDIRELVEYDIQRILNNNCKIDLASNGGQAIEFLDSKEYDVVLVDYHLPDISGKMVQKASKTQTPFVYISGDMNIHSICDGKSTFALEKPFRSEDLETILFKTLKKETLH